jgi:restriction endonuclease Mrr
MARLLLRLPLDLLNVLGISSQTSQVRHLPLSVRDFYGTVSADQQAVKGVMITTSDYTNQAKEFAAQVNVELIDGEKLQSLMDRYVEPNHQTHP